MLAILGVMPLDERCMLFVLDWLGPLKFCNVLRDLGVWALGLWSDPEILGGFDRF